MITHERSDYQEYAKARNQASNERLGSMDRNELSFKHHTASASKKVNSYEDPLTY